MICFAAKVSDDASHSIECQEDICLDGLWNPHLNICFFVGHGRKGLQLTTWVRRAGTMTNDKQEGAIRRRLHPACSAKK
jgi:hypothetical protein